MINFAAQMREILVASLIKDETQNWHEIYVLHRRSAEQQQHQQQQQQ